jgi:hypothetical protein
MGNWEFLRRGGLPILHGLVWNHEEYRPGEDVCPHPKALVIEDGKVFVLSDGGTEYELLEPNSDFVRKNKAVFTALQVLRQLFSRR